MSTHSKPEPPDPEEGFLVVDNSSSDLSGRIDFFPSKEEAVTHVNKMWEKESPPSFSDYPFYIIAATRLKKEQP